MKRVAFVSLFFCLSITTILAQVVTTNIAAPDSNGFSNNQVSDFDVNTDGTILNNSATSGTATLGSTAVTGNSNITAGSEASLILLQVTGTSGSDLDGTIEVFGGEAGLIIANPNGITCDGCAFTNVNRVDLVTGSGYDADTNTFSTIAAADIDISSSGLTASVLKIQTGADFNNAGAIVADTVTIEVTNFADDVSNTGTVSSDSLNLILTDDFRNESNTLNGFNNFRNLTITTDGYFLNSSALDLDNLTIKTGNIFENREQITSDSFTAVVNNFNLLSASARINAVNFTATVEEEFNNNSGVINAASFTITTKKFSTDGSASINADTVTIEVPNFDDISLRGIVSSDSLNIILTDDFTHTSDSFTGFNNFSDLAITTNGTFTNNATINPDANLTIAANTFTNNATINPTGNLTITANSFANSGGVLISDALTVSLAGDFEYSGTITANTTTNLNVGGDFSYNDSASNFTWGENDILTVSGSVNITAASFNNSGTIDVDNSFTAMVDSFSNEDGATITVFGECNIVATTSTDSGTITCQNSEIVAMVFNIATPVDGLSNNQVDDFDVNAEGTILNNSAGGGTAQLGDIVVPANPNIATGSEEASLILFQVANTASSLNGQIEVFGGEARLIIANLNGITCDGCGFINTNRVDLVTGNYDLNTNTFGDIAATDITLGGSRLELDVLNIQTGRNFSNSATIDAGNLNITAGTDFNNYGAINTDNLNITAGTDFNNYGAINTDNLNITAGDDFSNNSATINAGTVTIEVTNFANDIANTGTVSSASLNFILTDNFTHGNTSFSGFNFSNLTVSTDGIFTNTNNATIHSTGNTAITANTFNNRGVVNVGTFALSVAGDFDYANKGTITANTFNLNVDGNFSNNDANSNFTWGEQNSLVVSGNANITTDNYTQSGAITVDGVWTINAASDFLYNRPNNNFIWDTNDSLTVGRNASIDVAGFANSGTISVNTTLNTTVSNTSSGSFNNTGGEIEADTFALSVAGDFDFADKGTLTTTAFNLDVDGNFSYADENTNFVWDTNDILTVLGNANIVAASFNNSGTINVTNIFDITAAANFTNAGTISANSFNATVDRFSNQSGARITAGECNIVVHTSSSDNGTITCLDSADTVIDIIAIPTDGLSDNSYETFHIPPSGRVFNNSLSNGTSQLVGEIDANTNYTTDGITATARVILVQVTSLTDISLLLGTLEVFGDEAAVIIANPNGISCNACSFINASRVDLVTGNYNSDTDSFNNIANGNIAIIENGLDASSVGILNIHAGGFTNTGGLQANIFNLSIDDDFDYTQRGIINTTSFNLEVGGDFSNNDATTGFVWEERDTLTVSGTANITALNFINHGTIDITNSASGSFEITTGYTAINQGSIVSDILTINAADFFRNLTGGDIAVNTLNIIAGGKVTNTATIDVEGTLTITANNNSARTDDRTGFYVSNRGNITATTLNITAVDNFYNRGNITADNFNITRAKDIFFLNKEIDSYDGTYDGGNISLNGDSSFIAAGIIENYGNIISLTGDSSFIADGGSIQNYGHIDLGNNILDISADSFTNHEDATIDAATLNLAVNSYINDG